MHYIELYLYTSFYGSQRYPLSLSLSLFFSFLCLIHRIYCYCDNYFALDYILPLLICVSCLGEVALSFGVPCLIGLVACGLQRRIDKE